MVTFAELLEQSAGFPGCPDCAFLETGFSTLCYACASDQIETPDEDRCWICEQTLLPTGQCGNSWCSQPVDQRYWDFVWAVAKNTGHLRQKIHDYKYRSRYGWGQIFARVLVGFLDDHAGAFERYHLIAGVPEFLAPPRTYSPVGLMIEQAAIESGSRWPFDTEDPPVIIKTQATTRMTAAGGLAERRYVACTEVRQSLQVTDPDRVAGRNVLLVDDVFTEGSTLREVARSLVMAGAEQVSGVVLARQPWQP